MNIILNRMPQIRLTTLVKRLALGIFLTATFSAGVVHAQDRGPGHRGDDSINQQGDNQSQDQHRNQHVQYNRHEHGRSDREWRQHEFHARGHHGPDVVYAPPAVVEYPQSENDEAPGINLIIPLNIN